MSMYKRLLLQARIDGVSVRELRRMRSLGVWGRLKSHMPWVAPSVDSETRLTEKPGSMDTQLHEILESALLPYVSEGPAVCLELGVSHSYFGTVTMPFELKERGQKEFMAKWARQTWGIDPDSYEFRFTAFLNEHKEKCLAISLLPRSIVDVFGRISELLKFDDVSLESCLPRAYNLLVDSPDGTVLCISEQMTDHGLHPVHQIFAKFSGRIACHRHFSRDLLDIRFVAKRLAIASESKAELAIVHRIWNKEYGALNKGVDL